MKRWTLRISPRRAAFGGLLCLIFLTGGAITTVAVAWGCAWTHLDDISTDPRIASFNEPEVDRSIRPTLQEIGRLGTFGWRPRRGDTYLVYRVVRWDRKSLGCLSECHEERWENPPGSFTFWNGPGPQNLPIQTTVSAGWPFYALTGEEWSVYSRETENSTSSATHRIEVTSTTKPIEIGDYSVDVQVLIPFSPIWPGFVIDTLFYAAIWFGVFFGFTSAKRAIRRKRGRCPRCGYDLRGGVSVEPPPRPELGTKAATSPGCPECGWNRTGTT